ncbi:putative lipoprotein [Acetobacter orientalis]|uniref:Putative lipoprotein n=1 Tax=Acetobacter orientalis TaxID=146474 RepID=A0A2Z5ZDP7_9PROT|nr:putative lipoprotein [Acetobacter orientalis]
MRFPSLPALLGREGKCLFSSALEKSCGGIRVSTFTHPALSV